MKEAFKFSCNARYGVPKSLLVDPHKNWILGGTSRGIFQLYDIRFSMQLQTWAHPALSAINCLKMSYQGNVLAGISGEFSEVSEWDIENAKCRKIWCSLRTQNSLGEASTEANIDQELRKVYNNNLSINEPKESIDVSA